MRDWAWVCCSRAHFPTKPMRPMTYRGPAPFRNVACMLSLCCWAHRRPWGGLATGGGVCARKHTPRPAYRSRHCQYSGNQSSPNSCAAETKYAVVVLPVLPPSGLVIMTRAHAYTPTDGPGRADQHRHTHRHTHEQTDLGALINTDTHTDTHTRPCTLPYVAYPGRCHGSAEGTAEAVLRR